MRRIKIAAVLTITGMTLAFLAWRSTAPGWDGSPIVLHEKAEDQVELLFFGDSGSGLPDQFKVSEAMERYCLTHHLAAVFMLGDNFYPQGVKNPSDPQWQSKFRDPYEKPCLSQVPFYAILGNHDYKGHPEAQIAYSHSQKQWRMPHRFYSVQFGELAKIIAIDTNIPDLCGSSAFCALDFMRKALADRSLPLRIVIGHHPITRTSGKHEASLSAWFIHKSLCGSGALYISGHSHHLEHRQDKDCSLDLFVSGGGGAQLYPIHSGDPLARFAQSTHGFLSLSASRAESNFSFFDVDLRPLYSYKRDK